MMISDKTWARLVEPIHTFSAEEFNARLRNMYGIECMVPETDYIHTTWTVTFISEYARTIFMLKHGHLL